MKNLVALVGLSLVCGSGSLPAQFGWVQMSPGIAPPGRDLAGMANDRSRDVVVLFGGRSWDPANGYSYFQDTWEWDGIAWHQNSVATVPPVRQTMLAYDDSRGVIVMFGGEGPGQSKLGDTWEYDGVDWVQRTPLHSPVARAHHGLVYDAARQRTVLFGGFVGSDVNDTWEWDGVNWTTVTPLTSPSPRHGFAMAYNALRQKTVLFGGSQSGSYQGDTWEFDGATWQQMSSVNSPAPRSQHEMASAESSGAVIMMGGYQAGSTFDDTWRWDGLDWQLVPAISPAPRRLHRMVAAPQSGRLMVFGGSDCTTCSSTNTQFELPDIDARFTAFGSGCLGPNGQAPVLGAISGDVPRFGSTFHLRVSGLPLVVTIPLFVFGFSNTQASGAFGPYPLPQDLGVLGWPGCDQLVALDGSFFTITTIGYADHSVAIPSFSILLGLEFHAQALVLYAQAGVAVSNGLTGTVGY